LENFHGGYMKAAKDDYRFGIAHQDAFERVAIIGDKGWGHWLAIMAKPFIDAKVRFFQPQQASEAWGWGWQREPYAKKRRQRK